MRNQLHKTAGFLAAVVLASLAMWTASAQAVINPADFSILEAQIGYKSDETKRAFIVSTNPTTDRLGTFQLRNATTDATVFTGNVTYWGQKWGEAYWTMDFSSFKTAGSYYIDVPSLSKQSDRFSLQADLFRTQTLLKTSVDQLEPRIRGKLGWQDCGTDLRGVEGHATLLYGLIDAYEAYGDRLSATDEGRFLDQMRHGADYMVACQKPNGSFCSEYYFYPNIVTWHKSLLATIALLQVYEVTRDAGYLRAAQAGWDWAMSRPEFTKLETAAEVGDTRQVYGQRSPWLPPQELRTRDKLLLVWGATEFFRVTRDTAFKTIALNYADQVYDNQFLDYTNAVEGMYGNFYAWTNEEIFQKSWEHGAWYYNNGAVLPDHILGLVKLVEQFPNDPNWLKWRYILRVYKDRFLKPTHDLSPFGIYPLGMYDREVRFFGPTWHGTNGMYGNIAKNAMLLARMFDDVELQEIADANMQWVGGLNAGTMLGGKRQSISMIDAVGTHYVPTWSGIDGSIANGLSATPQFTLDYPEPLMDAPVTFTHEDWIVHSGGWLSGLSEVERAPVVRVVTKNAGAAVSASVRVDLDTTTTHSTNASGELTLSTLPRGQRGTISATYGGRTVTRDLSTIAGEDRTFQVDFADSLAVTVTADPATLAGTVSVTNDGSASATVSGTLAAVGATLSSGTFSGRVASGATQRFAFTFADDDPQKIQPFLIRATAQGPYSAASAETVGELPVSYTPNTTFSNHDFESGNLSGWTVTSGTAFGAGAVVNANTAVGGSNEPFNKQGDYLLWGHKLAGDGAVGELRSPTFTIAPGDARLKVGGGNDAANLYVAVVDVASGTVLEKATGTNAEKMRWVVWDMTKYAGRQAYVRIYDGATGGWGHINADDVNVPVYSSGFSSNLKRLTSHGDASTWTTGTNGLTGTSTDAVRMSSRSGSNFTYETDVTLTTARSGALVFRSAPNPYTGGGYFVSVDRVEGKVKLFKVNPYTLIASATKTIAANTTYHLKVVTKNQRIKVYFNGESSPSIDVTDSSYASGRFGIGVYNDGRSGAARFNHTVQSPSTGFETTLGSFSATGNSTSWTEQPAGLTGDAEDGVYVSSTTGTNFTYQADIRLDTAQAAGLVFRSGANPFSASYIANFDREEGKVKLFKLAPGYTLLGSANRTIQLGTSYRLRVVVSGSSMSVYFDNEASPAVTVTDSAFASGRFGLSTYRGIATFNHVTH
ncbi:cellulase N-terminal Ig-like domain-containing protein [Conexibacter woesei]|uniref:Cellulase Ig-like domain-containing protein n=1 Tax=Conexibacter woesei (strain DSM 14684 / CCUG 47730 / CIP 108061 / JCM 11494 / NBRC 100937 / ID131577) TaxID=469383 RepID=D3F3P3_CONWI|nr:cellulase N-terminal Ig-like domain-containing protein [Conexibacter woesei]ADB52408.1 hypothetical protein Cwoe_3991 [Conexibacter woesei DSM 14684]